ncbi:ABC-type dipeptide transport system periplasmic component [Gammaproteobacteria bacterium]|nr:ABC-type dipeptide transport system periplasmic component [Gammaproteobacteria bacterium]
MLNMTVAITPRKSLKHRFVRCGLAFILSLSVSVLISVPALALTPKDTLVIGKNIEDIVALDPAEAYEFSSGEIVKNIYQGLVQYNHEDPTHVMPDIASKWEVSADSKTIIFTLNPNIKFESGNLLRPEDIIFSFKRLLMLNKAPAYILAQLGWDKDNIEQMVKKVDDSHLSIQINADVGVAFALNVLAARATSVVDEKVVRKQAKNDDYGNAYLNQKSAGSGPYKLSIFKPKEAVFLQANPHAMPAPKLAKVLIKNIPEPSAQRLILESGDIDIARNLGSDQIAAIKKNPALKVEVYPQSAIHFIAFNQKMPALQNPAFWEAARYLIDYKGISENIAHDNMRIHQAFLPVGFQGALLETPFSFQPEKAQQILENAGIKDLEITLDVINSALFMDMAQSIQASFAQAGIKLKLNPATASQVITRYRARRHEGILLYWAPDFFDPHANAKAFTYNVNNADDQYQSTASWRNAWLIPELSKLTTQALQEKDPELRTKMYQTLQQDFQKSSPIVIGFQEVNQVAMAKSVTGYIHGLTPDMVYFYDVTK